MNILFLSINFDVKVKGIYSDLIKELRDKGNNIYTVSTTERRNNLDTFHIMEDNINILKVKTLNIQKVNILEKGLATLLLEYQFIKAIKKYYFDIKFDLVINTTPPITFCKVIEFIKKRDNAKSYLLLKDIFPQNAVDINLIKRKSIIYEFFRKKEKQLYLNSDFIGCMSEKNKEYILKHNNFIEKEKVEVCPNSIKVNEQKVFNNNEKESIRKKLNISKDALVIIYGGNLGKPQGIDFLIDILKENKSNNKFHFYIIGNGTEYKKLEELFKVENFKNATLSSSIPKKEYDEIIKCADLGLILLDKRFTIPNFPSRLLSYMECSMPVIAATDVNTDIGKVILNGDFGYWCESGDIYSFNNILNNILKDKNIIINKGNNARKYLEKYYTVDKCSDKILQHFN